MVGNNSYNAKKQFELNGKTYNYYQLKALEEKGLGTVSRLPFSIRVLLESLIRQHDGFAIKDEHVEGLANWGNGNITDVPFKPSLCYPAGLHRCTGSRGTPLPFGKRWSTLEEMQIESIRKFRWIWSLTTPYRLTSMARKTR